jgi:predicted ester cyclase
MIPELLHENIAFRGSLGLMQHGHAGFAGYLDFVRQALGDYRCKIVDMVAEGDKVYARMAYSGVHLGDLFGYAATNAKLKWDGVAIFTFADGKIVDLWVLGDVHNVIRQLARHVDD